MNWLRLLAQIDYEISQVLVYYEGTHIGIIDSVFSICELKRTKHFIHKTQTKMMMTIHFGGEEWQRFSHIKQTPQNRLFCVKRDSFRCFWVFLYTAWA